MFVLIIYELVLKVISIGAHFAIFKIKTQLPDLGMAYHLEANKGLPELSSCLMQFMLLQINNIVVKFLGFCCTQLCFYVS